MKASAIFFAIFSFLGLCLPQVGMAGEDVQALIKKLHDEKERATATQQLINLGKQAIPELKKNLANQRGDMKLRLETILFEISNHQAKKLAEQSRHEKDIPAFLKKSFAAGNTVEQEQWLSLMHAAWHLYREAKNTAKSDIAFPNLEIQNISPWTPGADSVTESFIFLSDKEKPPSVIKNSIVLSFSDLATVTEINNSVVFCGFCKATTIANSFVHVSKDVFLTDVWNSTLFAKGDVVATFAKNNYILVGGKFQSGALEDSFVLNKKDQVKLAVGDKNNSFILPKSKFLASSFLFGE